MKFVLLGAAGHITRPLAETLLASGHDVTVVGRNAENLKPLTDKGAHAAIGSVEDVAFLTETFRGADAIYTMVPPNFGVQGDWKQWIAGVGRGYAEAIKASGVQYVVNLSSVGADQPEGCGPVSGLYYVEQDFNKLEGVNVLHLRAGYFYTNFFSSIGMVKGAGIIGGNNGDAQAQLVMAHPEDIADVAAKALEQRSFTGHGVQYVVSDVRTGGEVAGAIGKVIGKPELPWVGFSDEDSLGGMRGAGVPEEIAKNYVEMGAAIRTGKMQGDYFNGKHQPVGKHKLEDFAPEFAAAYQAG
ncbi:NAD-dependent dehydratase [Flaviaesturariibacter flavus]|uniref:NAD-dependent dehydratase n=1 Tax=Flaviaesturariibacter flavus TaxID=2502780 RepID=A0A4R1BN10_9BACT|nr:NAD(P)H-binding protein [Flaviaesturariibacter flavus]TCJ18839.1 NAD-dependent dehydratase [Flaviaesturariibacter flavus]